MQFKDSDYCEVEAVYNEAVAINGANGNAPGQLDAVLKKYQFLASKHNELKKIPQFDENHDVTWGCTSLALSGNSKLTQIKIELKKYLEQNKPIPENVVHVDGWKKANVLTVFGFFLALFIGFSIWMYDRGKDVAVSDKEQSFAMQNIQIDSLRKVSSMYADSLNALSKFLIKNNESLDSLKKAYGDRDEFALYISKLYKDTYDSLHNPAICNMFGGKK